MKSKQFLGRLLIAFCIYFVNMEMIISNFSIYQLVSYFHLNVAQLNWINSSYLLTFAGTIILCGRLSDRFGERAVLLNGLLLFLLSSVTAGFTPFYFPLIVCRLVQGFAAGLLFTAAFSLLFKSFSVKEKAYAQAISGMAAGAAIVLSPFIGGFLLEYLTWRFIFLINVPISIVLMVLFASVKLPVSEKHPESIPFAKAGVFIVGIILLLFSLYQMHAQQNAFIHYLLLLMTSILILTVFAWWECRSQRPLLELRLLKDRSCLLAIAIRFFAQGFPFVFYLAVILLAKKVLHLTPLQTTLLFVIPGLFQGIASFVAGHFIVRWGHARLLMPSCVLLCVSSFALAATVLISSPKYEIVQLIVFNSMMLFSTGLIMTSVTTYVVAQTTPNKVGAANGLVATFAYLGAALLVLVASLWMSHVHSLLLGYSQTMLILGIIALIPLFLSLFVSEHSVASAP